MWLSTHDVESKLVVPPLLLSLVHESNNLKRGYCSICAGSHHDPDYMCTNEKQNSGSHGETASEELSPPQTMETAVLECSSYHLLGTQDLRTTG